MAGFDNQFIGEIRGFGGTYAPLGWVFCDGRELEVYQYQSLFALIGFTYGGNGSDRFKVPDLRGRIPMSSGQGSGLSNRPLGESGGSERIILNLNQMPEHSHFMRGTPLDGDSQEVAGRLIAKSTCRANNFLQSNETVNFDLQAIGNTGGNDSVSIVQPYAVINFIIATDGVFPPRIETL